MCQILALTTHDPAKRDDIIASTWRRMWANGHKDGFGAAWFSPDGQIGFYKSRHPAIPREDLPAFVKMDFSESKPFPSDGGFLIIHGRNASTNNKISLENTHPMFDFGWENDENPFIKAAMIHNGLVYSDIYDNQYCTCDSELLMQAYAEGGGPHVSKEIQGRFAFMYLDVLDGVRRLHVARDSNATITLAGGYYHDGFVFATVPDLISALGGEHFGEISDNQLIIFTDKDHYDLTKIDSCRPWSYTYYDHMGKQAGARSEYPPKCRVAPKVEDDKVKKAARDSYEAELTAELAKIEQELLEQGGHLRGV